MFYMLKTVNDCNKISFALSGKFDKTYYKR
jgi:hypothetical protein